MPFSSFSPENPPFIPETFLNEIFFFLDTEKNLCYN
jgi:hypothetical protein